jgi:Subtilase family
MRPALDDTGNASRIRRMGSLNNVATARTVLVVGGYVYKTGQLSSYSAGGPVRAGVKGVGVDVLGVADCAPMDRGVRSCGVKSGTTFRMNGTSVAAPQVTRWVAHWMSSTSTSGLDWSSVLAPYTSIHHPQLRGPTARTGSGRLALDVASPPTTAQATPSTPQAAVPLSPRSRRPPAPSTDA